MRKKTLLLSCVLVIILFLSAYSTAANPEIEWFKTFGGINNDYGYCVQQTSDDGYIIVGVKHISESRILTDIYLIKTDSEGNKIWENTFGGSSIDYGYCVQQTSDGGYIITGLTYSFGEGMADVYLIKTDSYGNRIWDKTFGGTDEDYGRSVQQTSDGGYIISGHTRSYGAGGVDCYLIKTDSNGDLIWENTFGGTETDNSYCVKQTTDNGYIIAGNSISFSGNGDVYLLKTDSNGNMQWEKTFGGSRVEQSHSVQQTSDGGYIISGQTASYGSVWLAAYLIKTDSNGNLAWEKTFGMNDSNYGRSVQQTTDGGYITAGITSSFVEEDDYDVYLIRTDTSGNLLWEKAIGGSGYDAGNCIQKTSDGGYIIAGQTSSYGQGGNDVYLIKMSPDSAANKIIYVDDDGPADFDTIQAAIDDANDGDTVLVAPGTYTGEGNRDIEFKGKAITVKSENGPETCIIDCQGTLDEHHFGFTFYDDEDVNSIVQGFTITRGYGSGGIICHKSSPLIADCLIIENTTLESGGGIRCVGSDSIIIRCYISNNNAASFGGGLFTSLILYENTISQPTLINCTISGNNSLLGGGIYCLGNSVALVNCTITGNWARSRGGGISFSSGSSEKMCNSIIYGNKAPVGREIAAVHYPNIVGCRNSPIINIAYSIVGSEPNDIAIIGCPDLVMGEWLHADPLFVNPGYWDPNGTQDDPNDDFWVEGDYHLKSQAGRWDPTSGSWVIDDITSPCIDAGDPNSPIGYEPFPNGGIINMGAYGGTAEASMSLKAYNPDPPDGANYITLPPKLRWTSAPHAVSHDIYFGPNIPPPFVYNQTETVFNLSLWDLEYDDKYYWRIDEIDNQGNKIIGDTWEFTASWVKGCACFTGDTCVWVDGANVPISEVTAGQNIGKVETVQEHKGVFTLYDIVLDSGNCITVAENHYFMSESGRWLSLHELKEGEKLKTSKGSISIKSVTKQPKPYTGKVYNLKIRDSNKYTVGEDAVIVRDY